MKFSELNPLITTVGWTLLHSLWQGLAIWMVLKLSRRLLTNASSTDLYALSTCALGLVTVITMGTFAFLSVYTRSHVSSVADKFNGEVFNYVIPFSSSPALSTSLANWVNANIIYGVLFWMIGVVVFGIRLYGAWLLSSRLETTAEPITGYWYDQLAKLSNEIGLKSKVAIAQCETVGSPIILGFLKPVILLPVGMLNGLTTAEIETILVHELAHVRRQDYLINLIQSVIETVLFFNPFVWLISADIRTDRELCCDDVVVEFKNPLTYAKALHRLEEERVWGNSFGLAAAGNRNYLLKRIKRIMSIEKKESSPRRIYAVLLVVMVLAGCSWLSVEARLTERSDDDVLFVKTDSIIKTDTTIKGLHKLQTSSHSKSTIVIYDEKGNKHEEVKERVEGDTLDRQDFNSMFNFSPVFQMPMSPDEAVELNFVENPFQRFDTLPSGTLNFHSREEMEDFTRRFVLQFKQMQNFADSPEFGKMMNDMQNMKFNPLEINMEAMDRAISRADELRDQAMEKQTEIMDREADQTSTLDRVMSQQQENLRLQRLNVDRSLGDAERNLALANENLEVHEQFQRALKKELIKDGYLGKNEDIKNLEFTDDNVTVNGKAINDKDKPKYEEFRRNFFSGKGRHIE
jgi:bla regulator protein blaR1